MDQSPAQMLRGTWRSDKRQMLKNFHAYHESSMRKKRVLGGLFGKMEIRWTPKFAFVTLDGDTTRERYEVVAEDSGSIVVRCYSEAMRRKLEWLPDELADEFFAPRLHHIHFEAMRGKQYYWIGLGTFCEWFKKVNR